MKFTTVAITLLASITAVQAGVARVVNHCPFDVFLKTVSQGNGYSDAQPIKVLGRGASWQEDYRVPPAGGVAIKLATNTNFASITQFEYTLTDKIWYDGSNINCNGNCPFKDFELILQSSDGNCPSARCAPGSCGPDQFYLKPDDDKATKACQPNSDVTMHLCNGM